MEAGIMKIDKDCSELFSQGSINEDPNQLPPLVLAYVGDAVYELYIRLKLISKPYKPHELHQHAVRYVKAESQSKFLAKIESHLTDEELQIMRRGRNAKGNVPRNADVIDYRRSTGFEALIGYLYLSGQKSRLAELFALLGPIE